MLLALLLAQIGSTPPSFGDVSPMNPPKSEVTRFSRLERIGRTREGGVGFAFFEFAPLGGAGMGSACAGTTPTGAKGEALTFVRASVAECPSNDGQTYTQLSNNIPVMTSGDIASTWVGYYALAGATNWLTYSRDLSNAAWTKTTMTCTLTATGMRNDANSASTCTATAGNGTVLQAIVRASETGTTSLHIKRRTGTGTIEVTRNGGANWYAITSFVSSTRWRRVVPTPTPGCYASSGTSDCILVLDMASTIANPSVGIRLGTNGDAVDIDFVQTETGANATPPVLTTAAAASRASGYMTADLGASTGIAINEISMGFTHVGPLGGTATSIALLASAVAASDSSGANAAWLWTDAATGVAGQMKPLVGNAAGTTTSGTAVGGAVPYGRTYLRSGAGNQVTGASGIQTMPTPVPAPSGVFGNVRYLGIGDLGGGGFSIQSVIKGLKLDTYANRAKIEVDDPLLPPASGTVVWIGDSIIAGAFSGPRTPVMQLQSLANKMVHQAGTPGAYVTTGSAGIQKCTLVYDSIKTSSYSTLVWSCAINSLIAGGAVGTTIAADAQVALADARSRGKKVIITGVMPYGSAVVWTAGNQAEVDAYNASMSSWAGSNGATYISTASLGSGSPLALTAANNSGDGLHPSPAGARALADLVNGASP